MNKTKKWNEYLLDYALYVILGLMIVGEVIAEPSFLSMNNM